MDRRTFFKAGAAGAAMVAGLKPMPMVKDIQLHILSGPAAGVTTGYHFPKRKWMTQREARDFITEEVLKLPGSFDFTVEYA